MHSMSGSAGAGGGADHGGGQLYEDHQPANGFVPFGDDKDAGSMFFQNSASGAGRDAPGFTPSYESITDYLQGFLDPVGLARHLDAPPVYAATGQELSVGDMIGHDGRHGRQAGGGGTPNSSTSGEQENEERRQCKRGSAAEEGDQEGEIDEEKSADQHNPRSDEKKQKKKGKVEKKARGSRVAFATKSEVDHLDDGYRWRKYGQKAVKNSTFPRSYYRCTAARCGVKKQVERSQQDPSTVVTTYEGHHAHPSPAARGMATGLYSVASLQQQRHGMYPSSPDDIFLAAARAMAAPAVAASPAVPLPRHTELGFPEYYGMHLQDALLDPLAGNQQGHR